MTDFDKRWNRRRAVVALFLCLAGGIAFAYWVSIEPPTSKAPRILASMVGTSSASVQASAPHLSEPAAVAASAVDSASPLPSSMARKFGSIVDGRSFVLDAWQHPELGGKLYASRVAGLCELVVGFTDRMTQAQPAVAEVGAENYQKAAIALSRLQLQCGQFTTEELSTYSTLELIRKKDRTDALINLMDAMNAAEQQGRQSPAVREALQSVLNSAEPMLLDQLGMSLYLRRDEGGAYFFVDGERIPLRDGSPVMAAAYLLPCEFGLPCGGTQDQMLLLSCASGAGCFDSRQDKIAAEIGGNPGELAKAREYLAKLVAMVKSRDANRFFPGK